MSSSNPPSVVRIGVLGCGNVGAAFVQLLQEQAASIEARTGIRLQVAQIAVRNVSGVRNVSVPDGVITHDAAAVVQDPTVDLVVEVMGGIEPAHELIVSALNKGKPVVTANKELLANMGTDLFALADEKGVDLLFEAAVGGGIPIMRVLRESLRGEPVRRVMGIVNGTTNYILTKMSEENADYAVALSEAQRLGFAERDPTADVEGHDAAAKAAIIANIAFGAKVVAGDVYREGMSSISESDIAIAHRLGYVVKLLAIAERDDASAKDASQKDSLGSVSVRVHPAMVPIAHPLASVRHSFNAVFVEGESVGSLMFYGRGAGGNPTASAVLGDVIDAAINISQHNHGVIGGFTKMPIRPIDDTKSEYLVSLDVADRPGVLHAITGVFARHEVSIRTAEQEGMGDDARLVFITHAAREADVQACLREFRGLDVVKRAAGLLRVISAQ